MIGPRRITPRDGERPSRTVAVEPLDAGGVFRPAWRPQDPSLDPKEPYGSESSSSGNDHGWSNCTMAAGALALAYDRGYDGPYPGDLRHRQSDQSGGTDLYDLRDAWAAYGSTLTIKSGAGWSALVSAHDARRAVVVQGEGNVPGAETFDGGHACCIGVETRDNGDWLFGDPLATGWQWVSPGSIRSWAERWQSSIAFAVSAVTSAPPEPPEPLPPEPEPEPVPLPEPEPESYTPLEVRRIARLAVGIAGDRAVGAWVRYLEAPRPAPADAWDVGAWDDGELYGAADPCAPAAPAAWSRGPVPAPVADAAAAIASPAAWDGSAWRAALWRA